MSDKLTDEQLAEHRTRIASVYLTATGNGELASAAFAENVVPVFDYIAVLTKERDLAQSVALMQNEVREKLERQLETIKGRLTEARLSHVIKTLLNTKKIERSDLSIDALEKILNSEETNPVRIMPDGSVVEMLPTTTTIGAVAKAIIAHVLGKDQT